MELQAPPEMLSLILRGVFGPVLPPAKTEQEMRWEDDGGALAPDKEGWDHAFVSGWHGHTAECDTLDEVAARLDL